MEFAYAVVFRPVIFCAGMETSMTSRVTPLRDPDPELLRIPPYNTEAEQALLGAILINNAAYLRVSEFLQPEHFGNAVHGRIFGAVGKLLGRGQIANPVTLKNLFDQDGALTEIGGAQYLARLAAAAVTIINAEDYGRAVHDLYLRRELITVGEDVVNDAFRQDLDDPARQADRTGREEAFRSRYGWGIGRRVRNFSAALTNAILNAEAAFKRNGKTVGVATGFVDLDRKLGGLHPSDLIVLAGRPSMGKTALATNIAFHAARNLSSRALAPDGFATRLRMVRLSASSRSKCRLNSLRPVSLPRNRGFLRIASGEATSATKISTNLYWRASASPP